MIKKREIQSPQKEFGELFAIYKPDLKLQDDSPRDSTPEDDYDPADLRYDLRPEFPSHVPTPETINLGINNHIRNMFAGDDEKARKRNKRQRNRKQPVISTNVSIVPAASPPASPIKILIASPFSTKWGSDVWNSIKMNSNGINTAESSQNYNGSSSSVLSSKNSYKSSSGGNFDERSVGSDTTSQRRGPLRRIMTKQTVPPSRPVGKSLFTKKQSVAVSPTCSTLAPTPKEGKEKTIVSEETVERIAPTVTVANPNSNKIKKMKTSSVVPSPLQRIWMMENALNLHTLCQRDENEELPLPRRSTFMPRLPRHV